MELELKKTYLELNKNDADSAVSVSNSLNEINKLLKEHHATIEKANIRFCFMEQEKISDINSKLSTFSLSEQVEALTAKGGDVYELLKERGVLLKKNFEERENLAKLLIMISQISDSDLRYRLIEAVKRGKISEAIIADGCSNESMEKVSSLFNRLGMSASFSSDTKILASSQPKTSEISFLICNKKVWVSAEAAGKLTTNISNIEKISPQLQWKNAQRQIMTFSDTEEQEFAELQKKYLALLKEQDEILGAFIAEENLKIKVS